MTIFSSDGGKSQRKQLLFRAVSSTLQALSHTRSPFAHTYNLSLEKNLIPSVNVKNIKRPWKHSRKHILIVTTLHLVLDQSLRFSTTSLLSENHLQAPWSFGNHRPLQTQLILD